MLHQSTGINAPQRRLTSGGLEGMPTQTVCVATALVNHNFSMAAVGSHEVKDESGSRSNS
jgi:hypothetical protein